MPSETILPGASADGTRSDDAQRREQRTLKSFVDAFSDHADRPALIALRDGTQGSTPESVQETWSFGDLQRTIGQLAAGLNRAGLGAGETVALLAPNRPEWVVAYFAIVLAGGIAVPIDPLMSDGDLARVLRHSGCRRIFTTSGHVSRLRSVEEGQSLHILLLDEEPGEAPGLAGWRRLLAAEPAGLPDLQPDRSASLLYTSGTTGAPKGVPLSHANLLANVEALVIERLARPEDRVLLPLPLHHVYPFTVGLLTPLAIGAAVVMPAGMTGPQILQALRVSEATIMIAVPRLLSAVLTGIEAKAAGRGGVQARLFRGLLALSRSLHRWFGWRLGRRLFRRLHAELSPNLHLLASGGARLDPEVEATLGALGWEVLTGYGLTETAPILTFNPPGRARVGSAGLPVPGVELRIDPVEGSAPGQSDGEVVVRGPNVFAGYYDNPTATEAAFTRDGWFRTGDLGYRDRDGYLYLVGRVKEVLVLASGKNILPDEIEKAYLESPYLKDIGILERKGQLAALIVPDMDAVRARGAGGLETLLRDEIEAISSRLPSYQRLSGYAVTTEPLPRTPIGKLRRHLLPEMFDEAAKGRRAPASTELSEADKSLLQSPLGKAVWDWLGTRFPDRTLTLDTSPQLDLGMDSLEWVSLGLEMQGRFGIELTEDAIARVVTLRDLLQEIQNAKTISPGDAAAGDTPPLTPQQARWLEPLGPVLSLLSFLIYGLNWAVMRVLFRLRVHGTDRLPQAGAVLFTPNHASYLDPLVLAAALPWRLLGRTYWAGAVEVMFPNPIMRFFSRITHVFPVDAYRGANRSLTYGVRVLSDGKCLVWFPEGRRSPKGELLPFLPGVGVIAEKTKPQIIPVWIDGTFEALPVNRRLPRLRPVRVSFGRPLTLDGLAGEGTGKDEASRVANALHAVVGALGGKTGRE